MQEKTGCIRGIRPATVAAILERLTQAPCYQSLTKADKLGSEKWFAVEAERAKR